MKSLLMIALLAFSSIQAEPKTGLYLFSSTRHCIGDTTADVRMESPNQPFTMTEQKNGVAFSVSGPSVKWDIKLAAASNDKFTPGIYKRNGCYCNEPVHIMGYGPGYLLQPGEFEVFDVKYAESGPVESFAANFVQRCEKTNGILFGVLRYRSDFPFETTFKDLVQPDEAVLYMTRQNTSVFLKTKKTSIRTSSLDNINDLEIKFEDAGERWTLNFAPADDRPLAEGDYLNAQSWYFYRNSSPSFLLSAPQIRSICNGEFKVLEYRKGTGESPAALAINFSAQTEEGEPIAGAIRLNSNIPVNLEKPY